MKITVSKEFIYYRSLKAEIYNRRGRKDAKFLMDLDCELYEWYMIHDLRAWSDHPDWKVDALIGESSEVTVDVKFIQKYWNVSGSKITNILQQRKILDYYLFMEWVDRPKRPLVEGDEVEMEQVSWLTYDEVADNLRPSFKAQGQYYLDPRRILEDA